MRRNKRQRLFRCRKIRRSELTEHHRKPRSQGGEKRWPAGNIALISREQHEAWHGLFRTWPANVVAAEATRYMPPGVTFVAVPLGQRRLRSEPEWQKHLREQREIKPDLWIKLFTRKRRSAQEIAAIISRYFLDPEFELMAIIKSPLQAMQKSAAGG